MFQSIKVRHRYQTANKDVQILDILIGLSLTSGQLAMSLLRACLTEIEPSQPHRVVSGLAVHSICTDLFTDLCQ